jgi:hypothetical protein
VQLLLHRSHTYLNTLATRDETKESARHLFCVRAHSTMYLSLLVETSYQSTFVTAFVRPRTLNFTFVYRLLVLSPLAKRIPARLAMTIDSAPTRAVSVSTQTTNQSPQAWPHTLKGITMLFLSNLFNMTIFMSVNLMLILLSNLLQTTWD